VKFVGRGTRNLEERFGYKETEKSVRFELSSRRDRTVCWEALGLLTERASLVDVFGPSGFGIGPHSCRFSAYDFLSL
jgi:hypothetical protein